MDGIGTVLYENGYCYQGMFEKGSREGLGITYDNANNKYIGEHRDGMRQGRGKIIFSDGGVYTGGWNKNKKHGRGEESFVNDSFLVYYNSGYREQVLSKTDSKSRNDSTSNHSIKPQLGYSTSVNTYGQRPPSLAGEES